MTPRALLVRGLLAGLLAGFATFLVAYTVGEPQVERAIELEESVGIGGTHSHETEDDAHEKDDTSAASHSHGEDEEGGEISRHQQRVWGLLTGSLTVSVAIGGLMALIAATAMGRIGRLTPMQSTAVVSLVGFVAFALVPFLKYPATPPAVGSGESIGSRTGLYFGFLLVSVAAAALALLLGRRLYGQTSAYSALVSAAGVYLVIMIVAGAVFPTVNEIGDFPGDVLWYFRRASLMTLGTQWAVIGVVLVGAVGRLQSQIVAAQRKRELAASL